MLRHIKLQFHQRKLRNTRMTTYPPFPLAEWTHSYLNIYFKSKIMPNYIPVSGLFPRDQVCTDIQDTTFDSSPFPNANS